MEAFKKAMAADGKYGKWIRNHTVVIKINDILFLHAGFSPSVCRDVAHNHQQGYNGGLGVT